MKTILVVTEPFGPYQRGDQISDTATIEAVQASENALHVVRTQVPDEAPPAKSKK